ncbi:hypothetical protein Fcan01_13844 [Folsomia candida]|uniref:Uncharacterized protein n=1 Tax=Folsomia candida TaxID=158441 RepID=A0A226E2T1_FOLCA|nr:hypothetical protein Fcan01_13844 [Folsomia candida]
MHIHTSYTTHAASIPPPHKPDQPSNQPANHPFSYPPASLSSYYSAYTSHSSDSSSSDESQDSSRNIRSHARHAKPGKQALSPYYYPGRFHSTSSQPDCSSVGRRLIRIIPLFAGEATLVCEEAGACRHYFVRRQEDRDCRDLENFLWWCCKLPRGKLVKGDIFWSIRRFSFMYWEKNWGEKVGKIKLDRTSYFHPQDQVHHPSILSSPVCSLVLFILGAATGEKKKVNKRKWNANLGRKCVKKTHPSFFLFLLSSFST